MDKTIVVLNVAALIIAAFWIQWQSRMIDKMRKAIGEKRYKEIFGLEEELG